MPISGGSPSQPFTKYTYSGALANGVKYVPADKTIVQVAHMTGVINVMDEFVFNLTGVEYVVDSVNQGFSSGDIGGLLGPFYCDGVAGFENRSGIGQTLKLFGMTMP